MKLSKDENKIEDSCSLFSPRDFVVDLYKKGHSIQNIYERLFLAIRVSEYVITLSECKTLTEGYILDYLRYNIP